MFGTPHFFKPRIPHPCCCRRALLTRSATTTRHRCGRPSSAGGFRSHQFQADAFQRRCRQCADRQLRVLRQHHPSDRAAACDRQRLAAPGFAATESTTSISGTAVSCPTPAPVVLDGRPRQDTLAFQVDLWNARGELPTDLIETEVRVKEIQFSSRTAPPPIISRRRSAFVRRSQMSCDNCRRRCATRTT